MNLKGSTREAPGNPHGHFDNIVKKTTVPRVRVLGGNVLVGYISILIAHRPARARIGGKTTEGGLYDGRNELWNYGRNELWGYFWGYAEKS